MLFLLRCKSGKENGLNTGMCFSSDLFEYILIVKVLSGLVIMGLVSPFFH